MKRLAYALALVALSAMVLVPNAEAGIGVEGFDLTFGDGAGGSTMEAGAHPFGVTNELALVTREDPELGVVPDGSLRDVEVSLPEGLVGYPDATPQCSGEGFAEIDFATKLPDCSDDSAVGVITYRAFFAEGAGIEFFSAPVYNLKPAPGEVQKLGFSAAGVPVTIDFKVSTAFPYNVVASLHYVPQPLPIAGSKLVVWGVPASPAHDAERGSCIKALEGSHTEQVSTTGGSCPSSAEPKAFVTLPRACHGPLSTSYRLDSWEEPGSWAEGSTTTHLVQAPKAPAGFAGCQALGFAPTIEAEGTNPQAGSPSGLDFDLRMDDPGLTEPEGRANSDIERAVVTLPEGFTTNSSVANGLGACTLEQYESESIEFEASSGCPDSAQVGTVEVTSPLVDEVLDGQIYVAQQRSNTFNSLLVLYMVIRNEQLGILITQPIKVDPNPSTGQLTSTVSEIPQLPFSDFHLHFRTGQRAPLITPPACGSYEATADLYPYAEGVPVAHRTATLSVDGGANGAPCPKAADQQPSTASFSAGTTSATAGRYSPFVLHVSRPDGSQQISGLTTTLPEGLLAKLAGVSYCPESGIAQAQSRSGEGEGAKELANPSCPPSSEVGSVTVAAGAGSEPLYVTGHAYLAGPYKGAPLSLEIITPAIAGPFDLGTVAVRTALQVNPLTAEVTAVSDPIPTILFGLPLDVRSISVDLARPAFTLNPTSCEPKAITASVGTIFGATVPLSQYFQARECGALGFKPKLRLSLKGSTKHAGHPALKAVLTYPQNGPYANTSRAQVNLPHSEFIDQGNLNKTCTKPVLLEGKCSAKSIYGKAKAWSPLLDKPLEGPVYLVGGFGYKLPALVAELKGQIRVLLVGKVDSGPNKGIRSTFETVPDAPVEKFVLEMKGGPRYSLLENSENLCARPQKGIASFRAQNARVLRWKPKIVNKCKPRSKSKHAKAKAKQHAKTESKAHGHRSHRS